VQGGKAIAFPAYSMDSSNITDEVWLATVADGKSRRVSAGLNGLLGFSVTSDSRSFAGVKSNRASSLWVSSKENPGAATIINNSIGDDCLGALGMDWTPNKRIVYSNASSGNADIWIVDSNGEHVRQLTDDPKADFSPVVSPDGRFIVFISNRSGANAVMRMNIDGTNVKELFRVRDAMSPSVSPDGAWVYFTASKDQTDRSFLWKVPIDGGERTQLTDRVALFPQVSPDGKFILTHYPRRTETGTFVRPVVPTILTSETGQIVKQFPELDRLRDIPLMWTADGRGFSFVETPEGVSNIWIQKISGGVPEKVTDFQTDEIFRYRWSPDGKMLAFEKGLKVNNVVLIRDKSQGD
jgi:TolB protein